MSSLGRHTTVWGVAQGIGATSAIEGIVGYRVSPGVRDGVRFTRSSSSGGWVVAWVGDGDDVVVVVVHVARRLTERVGEHDVLWS